MSRPPRVRPAGKVYSKTYEAYGLTIRVYEDYPGSNLMYSMWSPVQKREHRQSLRHKDRAQAERDAYARLQAVYDNPVPAAIPASGSLTALGDLWTRYQDSPAFHKLKPGTKTGKTGEMGRILDHFGSDFDCTRLFQDDIDGFVLARKRAGRGPQTARNELSSFKSVCRWAFAARDRVTNTRLLSDNAWEGLTLPTEKNPTQPLVYHNDYRTLLKWAASPACPYPLLRACLLIAHETAQRITDILGLRWEDIDWGQGANGTILWRAERNKMGYEDTLPMSEELHFGLLPLRQTDGWVFPSTVVPGATVTKWGATYWLTAAFDATGLPRPTRLGWHGFRRAFPNEHPDATTKDLMQAGRWKSAAALQRYQQADTTRVEALLNSDGSRLYRSHQGRTTVPNHSAKTKRQARRDQQREANQ